MTEDLSSVNCRKETPKGVIRAGFKTPRSTLAREPASLTARHSLSFKSPMCTASSQSPTGGLTVTTLTEEIAALKDREQQLDSQIVVLLQQGYREEELGSHIVKMHEYNEMKDVGQMLLGQIAMRQGVTTRDLYRHYGLDIDD